MAASSTSFRKGASGNPVGRREGSRNRTTKALDALLDGEAKAITRKAIEMAKSGDPVALRMVMDRINPVRRDRPITFALPPIEAVADLPKATAAILQAVSEGELTPSEAAELAKLVDAHTHAIKVTDLERRMSQIEGAR